MIKTIVTPQNNSLLLAIPNKYIGKEIEILFYAKEEVIEQTAKNINDASRYKGLLTDAEANKFDTYLKKARSEWDRDL